jgi:hypothetical protein
MTMRIARMIAIGGLMVAALAVPAHAVAPGRTPERVRCGASARLFTHGPHRWIVTFVLKNERDHRATVHGSWHVDARDVSRTVRHHADLDPGRRKKFGTWFEGGRDQEPTVELLRCR